MAFDFTKFMNLGNNTPQQNDAATDALIQSIGLGGKGSANTAESLGIITPSDEQDMQDAQDIMSIFGGGGA